MGVASPVHLLSHPAFLELQDILGERLTLKSQPGPLPGEVEVVAWFAGALERSPLPIPNSHPIQVTPTSCF